MPHGCGLVPSQDGIGLAGPEKVQYETWRQGFSDRVVNEPL